MKLLNQHVALPTVVSLAYEFVAASTSLYIAGFARYGTMWPSEVDVDVAPSLLKALLFGVLTVVGIAATGLYQAHYRRLSREAIVARIIAGLGLAALAETVVIFVAPTLALGRGIWGLSLLFSL